MKNKIIIAILTSMLLISPALSYTASDAVDTILAQAVDRLTAKLNDLIIVVNSHTDRISALDSRVRRLEQRRRRQAVEKLVAE